MRRRPMRLNLSSRAPQQRASRNKSNGRKLSPRTRPRRPGRGPRSVQWRSRRSRSSLRRNDATRSPVGRPQPDQRQVTPPRPPRPRRCPPRAAITLIHIRSPSAIYQFIACPAAASPQLLARCICTADLSAPRVYDGSTRCGVRGPCKVQTGTRA